MDAQTFAERHRGEFASIPGKGDPGKQYRVAGWVGSDVFLEGMHNGTLDPVECLRRHALIGTRKGVYGHVSAIQLATKPVAPAPSAKNVGQAAPTPYSSSSGFRPSPHAVENPNLRDPNAPKDPKQPSYSGQHPVDRAIAHLSGLQVQNQPKAVQDEHRAVLKGLMEFRKPGHEKLPIPKK